MDGQLEQAVKIGRENARLVELGEAWCAHIRRDRGLWGVGMVEEMTGLPVSGGRFACDFAREPTGFSGMQLAESALVFYESNCVGCPDHTPGGRSPNLSTWAERIIAERSQRQADEMEAKRISETEREHRVAQRRQLGASLSAAGQELVDAVNGLDAGTPDANAAASLRTAAQLASETFPDSIKEMLYRDALLLKHGVFVEALVMLESPKDPPALHSLCVDAVADGWGRAEGLKHLSAHGCAGDIANSDFLRGVIAHAASLGTMRQRRPGDCTALLHYHTLDSKAVEAKLASMLRHGYVGLREAAATALQSLMEHKPSVGEQLLPALLDGLRHANDLDVANDPAAEIASAVVLVLTGPPSGAESAVASIRKRWDNGSPEYRERLLNCYSKLAHTAPPDTEAATLGLQAAHDLAADALSEPYDPLRNPELEEYRVEAADLLRSVAGAHPSPAVDLHINLLLTWLDHQRLLGESQPDDPALIMWAMTGLARATRISRAVGEAAVAAASRNPSDFLEKCADIFSRAELSDDVRAEIVRMAGRAASQHPDHISKALPLIYTAMLSEPLAVRAAGMRAAHETVQRIPSESIPQLLAQTTAIGIHDGYCAVIAGAAKALQHVPADIIDSPPAINRLLWIAGKSAADPERDQLALDSLNSALHLAADGRDTLSSVSQGALRIIGSMPPYSARRALLSLHTLQAAKGWADTAINALRADDDPQYESLPQSAKQELLACIARQKLTETQIEELARMAEDAGRSSYELCRQFADALSELGRPDLGVEAIRSHCDGIPDTQAGRWQRRNADLVRCRFELEAAIASDDCLLQASAVAEAESLCTADEFAVADSYSHETGMATGSTIGEMLTAINTGHRATEASSTVRAIQARAEVARVLREISTGQDTSADALDAALSQFADYSKSGPEGDAIWAFHLVGESLASGVRWASACWNAEADSDRFLTAARMRAGAVSKHAQDSWPPDLLTAAERLAGLNDQDTPIEVSVQLRRIPLSPRITHKPQTASLTLVDDQELPTRPIALLVRFNGEPAMRPTVLRPYAMHRFQAEVRIEEWPSNADTLEVEFLSVHPQDFLYTSKLDFTESQLTQPLEIRVAGDRPATDPPLQLTARACFRRGGERIDTRIAGNPTLELATFDPGTASPPEQPEAARRLQEMMSELQSACPDLPDAAKGDIRRLLEGVLRFAHNTLDNRLRYQGAVDEAWFQEELSTFLRSDPTIGARLQQRAGAAGGQTDLLLGKTVIELKAETKTPISLDDAIAKYAAQATQYASARDAQVSLLVVLDTSPKRAPAGVMGNEMKWAYPDVASGQNPAIPSMVGTVIIRAGFPPPSRYSR